MPNFTQNMAVDQNDSSEKNGTKLSHKKWKALKKKEKRKAVRQAQAKQQEEQQGGSNFEQSPKTESSDEEKKEELKRHDEIEHRHWVERERQAQLLWQLQKEREERERQKIEEQKRQIQEEWEEREKKEKEEREEREKKEEEKRVKQVNIEKLMQTLNNKEALLKEATANENKKGDHAWHNPIAPANYGREQLRETCPFFKKTGACRFGDRCSRAHPDPEEMTTLLFPGMYSHFELEQTLRDEYDTDIGLEYEEGETYQHFKDFYTDVTPEFKKLGRVTQFKVCCNYEPHLRGNVYVQFRREEEAQAAYGAFNGRFYAGKQLSAQFVQIEKWKLAICGLYGTNRCPKGKNCNFLHVFRNPGNEFRSADFDQSGYGRQSERQFSDRHRNGYNSSRRSQSYRRSRSRDRVTRSRSHRRSRSKSRSRKHSRSRSPSRRRSKSPSRKRSRSPSRRSRSPSKRRSRSPSRKRSRSRDRRRASPNKSRRKKSRSRSRSRKNSVLKSRSKSMSPNSGDEITFPVRKKFRQRSRSRSRCENMYKKEVIHSQKKDIVDSVKVGLCDIPLPISNPSESVLLQKQDKGKGSESPESEKHSHRRKNKKHKKDKRSSHSDFKFTENEEANIQESVKNVSQSLSLSTSPSKLALVKDIIEQSLAE